MILSTTNGITQRQRWNLILILGGLMAMQPFALDPFLPAAPSIAANFAVDNTSMRLTIAGLSFGFAIGQLIAGPLSDSLGRRRPVLVAAALYVLASTLVITAANFAMFATGRVLQGVAGAAIQVVGNAIMRDLYAGYELMQMMSRVFLIQALSWVLGPLGGTLLLGIMDFRGITAIIGAYGVIMLVVAFLFLPETLAKEHRGDHVGVVELMSRFRSVLRDRIYLGVVSIGMLNSIALFGYLSTMPFIYEQKFGFSGEQYGYFFVLNSLSAYVGVQVIALIAKRMALQWIVTGILVIQLFTGLALFIQASAGANIVSVQITLMVLTFFVGGSFAPLGTLALTRHGDEAGTAAALNLVLGALASTAAAGIFTQLSKADTSQLGLMIAACFVLALVVMFSVIRPKQLR